MTLKLINHFEKFTPSETEKITGVSVDSQRDWRRRGIIRARRGEEGWSSFDLSGLIQIFVRRVTARAGFELQELDGFIAASSVSPIMFHALSAEGAIAFDASVPDDLRAKFPDFLFGGDHRKNQWAVLRKGEREAAVSATGHTPNTLAVYLQSESLDPANWTERNPAFAYTLLDYIAIGDAIARRAGKALVRVVAEDEDAD